MTIQRRTLFRLATTSLPFVSRGVCAQAYPARPVRVMLGFPPGGGADILTRLICDWLQQRLGQPFVVENRPGAATNLATEAVIRAPADGHTLLATTTSNLLNGALFDDLRFDFARDIAPVASLTTQPLALQVHPALPVRSVPEFIAHARANPGALNISNSGMGTVAHLTGELFRQATGIDAVSMPYRGSAPMFTDLIAGRIQATFENVPASIEQIRAGTVRALAVTSAAPVESLPGVPIMGAFIPGFEAFAVAGIGAPRGTPAAVVETLNAAINAGLADPRLGTRLVELGATIHAGSPGDFARLIARESDKWTRVIRTAGIRIT
jgi:tripartite-type tricarboxylate transporter receptor subunit TctC